MTQTKLDPWQFRISRDFSPDALQVAGMFLETGPDIDVVRVRDIKGTFVGILLGFLIDLDSGTLLNPSRDHTVAYELASDPDDFAEQVIASLAGRFLFIFAPAPDPDTGTGTGPLARIYPDCSAQVPCVYDPELKIAASTGHAMFDEETYQNRFDRALYDKLDVAREGWFPCGLTAHRGIERLLPNHYLDLQSWRVKRHWPHSAIAPCQDPMEVAHEVAALVRTQIAALLQGPKDISQALTAGHETRMLLACARADVAEVTFATITGPDRHRCDTIMARRIARDLDLRHIEAPRVSASQAQRDLFVRRGGHCMGDTNAIYHPSVWPLAEKYIMVSGLGGEIARAFLWHGSDTAQTVMSTDRITGRLGLAKLEVITTRMDAWLKDLPASISGQTAFGVLDLAYIEQRMGPWYAAQFYCDPTLVRIAPLMTRRVVELMLSLPPDWKRVNKLNEVMVQQNWPELGRYPYNSLGVWRDGLSKVQKAMRNPRIILKKLRKLSQ